MNTFIELGKFLISTTVLGGLIIWIFKEFLKMRFSRDLENHKGEIDNYFYQKKLKFSKLYEERALVIKELYSLLNKYHKSLRTNYRAIIDPIDFKGDKKEINLDKSFELALNFENYFDENKIILDEKLRIQIENLKKMHLDIMKKITLDLVVKESEKVKNINELSNLIKNRIPEVEKKLERL